jgi:hypothetical protein
VQEINKYIPDNQIGIWYGQETINNKSMSGIFNNINAIYLWQYTMVGTSFPNITTENFNKYATGDSKVVILSTRGDAFSLAQGSLNKINYDATLIESKRLQRGNVFLYCDIIEINPVNPIRDEILNGTIISPNNTKQIFSQENSSNLVNSLDKNIYGWFGRNTVITQDNGSYIFNPTSDRDHLATPFFSIQMDNSSKVYLVVVIDPSLRITQKTYSNARINLQDGNYSEISGDLFAPFSDTNPLSTEPIVNVIHLPDDSGKVRVYITSKDGHSALLPTGIELYEVTIDN